MAIDEEAVREFLAGFNCAQSVLAAAGPRLGLPREACLKVACAFGGGLARTGGVCGAVAGAFMAIGLRHGMVERGDEASRDRTYALARELASRFGERHGSTLCRELLGCDIGTPEGLEQARRRRFHTEICPAFVRDACVILEEILERGTRRES